jgi:hypothetical protein
MDDPTVLTEAAAELLVVTEVQRACHEWHLCEVLADGEQAR